MHVVRFVMDTVANKWPALDPSDIDANRAIALHGRDRRYYAYMQRNIVMATCFSEWLLNGGGKWGGFVVDGVARA